MTDKMYYLYHIPGKKIGVFEEAREREKSAGGPVDEQSEQEKVEEQR